MQTFTLNSRFMANVDTVLFFLLLLSSKNLRISLDWNITPLQSRKQNLCWGTSSAAGKKTPPSQRSLAVAKLPLIPH